MKTKSDLVAYDAAVKRRLKPKEKRQESQLKIKENREYSKKAKVSGDAAKFNKKLLAKNGRNKTSDKKSTMEHCNESGSTSIGDNAAFVTKNDLAKLLENLNENNNSKNLSEVQSVAAVNDPCTGICMSVLN